MGLIVDDPAVLAEVAAVFADYEEALMVYDLPRLDRYFWDDARALRYGIADIQHDAAAVAAYRRSIAGVPPRRLINTRITSFGSDVAVVNTEFVNVGEERVGRQSQTWVRTPGGWRIASAHVSMMPN